MELHLLALLGAPIWTLVSAILFPLLATIATFVCLRRAKLSHKLAGYFTLIPLYVVIAVVICGDTGGLISGLLPILGHFPVIGFLASICFGILCLNFTAIICGSGALKRKGALVNTLSAVLCFGIDAYLTYAAWSFAAHTDFLRSDGMIDVGDALPYLSRIGFLPESFLASGIEVPALAVLIIFLIAYFLSFIAVKTPDEIRRDEIERRRREALSAKPAKRKKGKDEEDDLCDCCAYCEYAERLKTSPTKMLCRKRGVVSSSHVCKSYVYDPLKRKVFRPRVSPLSQSDSDTI